MPPNAWPKVDIIDNQPAVQVGFTESAYTEMTPALRLEVNRHTPRATEAPVITADGKSAQIEWYLPAEQIKVEWHARRLGQAQTWEFGGTITNQGAASVTVQAMDPLSLQLIPGEWQIEAYRSSWIEEFQPVFATTPAPFRIETRSGRSSNGWSPWLGLSHRDMALVVCPAWSGNWHIDVNHHRVTAGISDWQLGVEIAPNATVQIPPVLLSIGKSIDQASSELVRAVDANWIPRREVAARALTEWNGWMCYEDRLIDSDVVAKNVSIAAELGIDVAVIDAGWFGPSDPKSIWPYHRGDWSLENQSRFPGGLRALGDTIRAAGMQPGLWMEIEAIGKLSELRKNRPELVALTVEGRRHDPSYEAPTVSLDQDDVTFLGCLCLGSPAAQEYALQSMEDCVNKMGATWLKIDFNVDLDAGCTRSDHGHGPQEGLFRHVEGLYRVLDQFKRRNPQVIVEACGGGGMRTDLGIARHVDFIYLSDADYLEHHLQVFWAASRMLPARSMFGWSWSEVLSAITPEQPIVLAELSEREYAATLRSVMLHRPGISARLPELPDRLRNVLAAEFSLYKTKLADFVLNGTVQRLTKQPLRRGHGEQWPAFQMRYKDSILVYTFRLTASPEALKAPLRSCPTGLDPAITYRATELGTGACWSADNYAGEALPAPTAAGQMDSRIFLIEPATPIA